ncbi:HTH domain-containing protein [Paenibacillus terrae]|uniref:Transposase n=1 Tax=Paenibacillus terrae TaxID=159743 RepID=A0A0D7WSU4_9BACL|nr:HTH domain-containing protein [Paenibacillus terrae]KJD42236.1 transposase [Paenibacillus terrae]
MGNRWSTGEQRFSESQIRQMEDNANVLHITERSIAYQPTFKLAALKAYQEGKTPAEIFREAGFNLDMIGRENPNRCLKRWRKTFASQGEAGLLEEQRGKGSTGRPAAEQSMEKKLAQAEARIKLLEAENDFLKKLEALERQAQQKQR